MWVDGFRVPSKSTICVDNTERLKGRVHKLRRREQVHDDGHAEDSHHHGQAEVKQRAQLHTYIRG